MNGRNKDEQTSHPTGFHFPHFPGAMEKFETDSKLEFAEKNPKKLSSELLVIGEQKITVPSTAIIKTGEWR